MHRNHHISHIVLGWLCACGILMTQTGCGADPSQPRIEEKNSEAVHTAAQSGTAGTAALNLTGDDRVTPDASSGENGASGAKSPTDTEVALTTEGLQAATSKCKTGDYTDSYGVTAPAFGYYICSYKPTRARRSDGTDMWFVVGNDFKVYEDYQRLNGTWSGWFSLAGTAQSRVNIDYNEPGATGISVQGTYNGQWCRDWDSTNGWGRWWDC